MYDGVNLPRMFRLVDPQGNRTIAYVEPGGLVQPQRMLGELVGVVGEANLDPALKMRIIDVERMDMLKAAPNDSEE